MIKEALKTKFSNSNAPKWLGLTAFIFAVGGAGATVVPSWFSDDESAVATPEQSQIELSETEIAFGATNIITRRALEVSDLAQQRASKKEDVDPTIAVFAGRPVSMSGTLAKNATIYETLEARGITPDNVQPVILATNKVFNFRKQSRAGDTWELEVNVAGEVKSFRYQTSPEHVWETTQNDDGTYTTTKLKIPVDVRSEVVSGTIETSLWNALAESSVTQSYAAEFMNLFAYKVDFGTDTQVGDKFSVLFEKVYVDGKFIRYGEIRAAYYQGASTGDVYAFRHDKKGESHYFDENGQSLRGDFLKSPISGYEVTSNYGKRFHPIHKKWKLHAGVDYAAPQGTPVQAIGEGKVVWAGRRGAYGNLVSIKHKNGYVTHYAHLHKIAKGVRKGKTVGKKTIIGQVGSTGQSTGPHLHFGLSKGINGAHINPASVKLNRGETLTGKALQDYKENVVLPLMLELRQKIASNPDG